MARLEAAALEAEVARLERLGLAAGALCRTCLRRRGRRALFAAAHVETAAEMLAAIAAVQLAAGDGLPDRVCARCLRLVASCFAFKQMCERSESILRCFITQRHLQGMSSLQPLAEDPVKRESPDYRLYLDHHFRDSPSPQSVIQTYESELGNITDAFQVNSETQSPQKNLSIIANPTVSVNLESETSKISKKKNRRDTTLAFSSVFVDNGSNRISKLKLKRQIIPKSDEKSETKSPIKDEEGSKKENIIWSTSPKSNNKDEKEKSFKCEECGKAFPSHHRLTRHQRIHQDVKLYNCTVCKKGFNDYRGLTRHVQKHAETKEENENVSEEQSFVCPQCHLMFTSEGDLEIHSSIHISTGDKWVCQHCKKEFDTNIQLKRHVKTHLNDKPHKCSVCAKGFSEMASLTRHFRSHTGEIRERKHTCNFCNKGYYDSHALKIHKRSHTGEKPWHCVDCDRRFTDSRLLNSHRKTHSDVKPHACDLCDKRFRHESTLITHKRTHTGEKPFICSVCGNAFVQSSNLLLHMRTHTREKPYGCKFCNKRFSSSSARTIHTRTHTGEKPYVCNVCYKRFARCDLKAHMRTHSIQMQHECPICHNHYGSPSLLQRHLQSHSEGPDKIIDYQIALKQSPQVREKPFSCIICGKAFCTSFFLKKHLTKAHNMVTLSLDSVCAKAAIEPTIEKLITDNDVKTEIVIQSNVINIPNTLALSENGLNVLTVSNSGIARIANDLELSALAEQHQIVSTDVGTIANAILANDKIYQIDPELLRIHTVTDDNLTHSTQISISEMPDTDQ